LHYWTWRLLAAGFSAEECVAIRGLGREVILDHARRAAEEGYTVPVERCLSSELLASLERHVQPGDSAPVAALLAKLPPGTTAWEVQLFLKSRGQPEARTRR
jgi:hypothetical protein